MPAHAAAADHVPAPEPITAAAPAEPVGRSSRIREPRHVHAIPTSENHKIAVAVDVFNSIPTGAPSRASHVRWALPPST